jgi:hypothetical protein
LRRKADFGGWKAFECRVLSQRFWPSICGLAVPVLLATSEGNRPRLRAFLNSAKTPDLSANTLDTLKQVLENQAGDFIYIKPGVPHEVFNLSQSEPDVALVARSSAEEWDNIIPYDRNLSR